MSRKVAVNINTSIRKNVLLIEEHELVKEAFRIMLAENNDVTENNYEINLFQATSAAEAFVIAETQTDLDMILLDICLPDIDGLHLISRFQEILPCVPVVVISGQEGYAFSNKALELGAVAYLSKTSEISIIKKVLGLVLAGKYQFDFVKSISSSINKSTNVVYGKRYDDIELPVSSIPGISSNQNRGHIVNSFDRGVDLLIDKLTKRQKQVLKLVCFGHSNKRIAAELFLSEGTIKNHVAAILSTMRVENRTHAALMAKKSKIINESKENI